MMFLKTHFVAFSLFFLSSSVFAKEAKKGKGSSKVDVSGKYFARYDLFLNGVGVVPAAFYFTISPLDGSDFMYDFVQCFSSDGGNSFTNSNSGVLVMTSKDTFHVNMIETGDIERGFAFTGTFDHNGVEQISLLSFFEGTSFTSFPEKTDAKLNLNSCPF